MADRATAIADCITRAVDLVALAKFLCDHPELDNHTIYTTDSGVFLWPDTEDDFANLVGVLKDRAPIGTVRKNYGDRVATVTRPFGRHGIELRVMADRGLVCEQVEVGTRTTAVAPVSCKHCGIGIKRVVDDDWWHIDAETGESIDRYCDDDPQKSTQLATPPDFGAVTVTTEAVLEWRCIDLAAVGATTVDRDDTEPF